MRAASEVATTARMSLRPLLQELTLARSRVQKLEDAFRKQLASLPGRYGFTSVAAFAAAVKRADERTRALAEAHALLRRAKREGLAGLQEGVAEDAAPAKPSPALAAPAAPPPSAPPPLPTGDSLEDPKNFGLLPDFGLLQGESGSAGPDLGRVRTALEFAQRVLHTSRVPAAVWREWRRFQQQAAEYLRTATAVTPDVADARLAPPGVAAP